MDPVLDLQRQGLVTTRPNPPPQQRRGARWKFLNREKIEAQLNAELENVT